MKLSLIFSKLLKIPQTFEAVTLVINLNSIDTKICKKYILKTEENKHELENKEINNMWKSWKSAETFRFEEIVCRKIIR